MPRTPDQLRFAKSHEWVDVDRSGGEPIATIGISDVAIEQLTELVYMDLPKVGRKLSAGEEFGEVESVKAVSPLYSPVSGEIVAVHQDLPDRLAELKQDPYEFGWIMKVQLSDEASLGGLLDHAPYRRHCSEAG